MLITDIKVKSAKPKEKQYKLTDGQGLYLLVTPQGGKLRRFKYYFNNKEKVRAVGTYPEIIYSLIYLIKDDRGTYQDTHTGHKSALCERICA